MTAALARRCVHTALAGGAFLLPLIPWWVAVVALILAALFNAAVLAPKRWLAQRNGAGTSGLVLYPLVLAILLLVFQERCQPVQCAWFAMAVGDGLAPLWRHGGVCWPWRRDKEVRASVLSYGLACVAMLSVVAWPVAIVAGVAGMLAETMPPMLDDNLSVPVAAAMGAAWAEGAAWAG